MGEKFFRADITVDKDYIWEIYNQHKNEMVGYKGVNGEEIPEIQRLDVDLLEDDYVNELSNMFEDDSEYKTVFAKIFHISAHFDHPIGADQPIGSLQMARGAALICPLQPTELAPLIYYDEDRNEIERVSIGEPTICHMRSPYKISTETVDRITFELSIYRNFEDLKYGTFTTNV